MARIIEESHAPSGEQPTYRGYQVDDMLLLCLHVLRGYRFLTCLYGTHPATGVQIPPKSSMMVDYAERGNPVTSPGATSGRHYRKACCWRGGIEKLEEANAAGKSDG